MSFKRTFLNLIINLLMYFLLIITIQNSTNMKKIKFINYESATLPLSFILGTSFFAGSICSNIFLIKQK